MRTVLNELYVKHTGQPLQRVGELRGLDGLHQVSDASVCAGECSLQVSPSLELLLTCFSLWSSPATHTH